MIYNYPDTILKKWVEWSDAFLSQTLTSSTNDLNAILGSSGSDNPSRAVEFFNLGLLKTPLTGNGSNQTYAQLRAGQSVISDYGYLGYLIGKVVEPSSSTVLTKAFKSICATGIVQVYETFKYGDLSISSIFLNILSKFPIPLNCDEKAYFRYLSAAMFCELEIDREAIWDSIVNNTIPVLRIIERGTNNALSTFNSPTDIKLAIDSALSLTGIMYEKGSIFFIGNHKTLNPRGWFYNAYSEFKLFLEDFHTVEIAATTTGIFNSLFKKTTTTNVILEIDKILNAATLNLNYQDLMKSLREGCLEALDILDWKDSSSDSVSNLNTIYYGAPGTGKSHKIESILRGIPEGRKERVTFHPEFDNSSFVGGYKPISELNPTTGKYEIAYKFVPQSFTKIYSDAWKNPSEEYYLVIEEINRGNCAEIFGELFQLLDRGSNYSIAPSKELADFLEVELGVGHDGIRDRKLRMPKNLYLLASMNTSDQSLFPMDSAFKRRWSWQYVPISYGEVNEDGSTNESYEYIVKLDENSYFKWIDFIKKVNYQIKSNGNLGLDKCIGNYFIKAEEGSVSLEDFVNKTMFYLWTDVFKDEENEVFPEGITYEDFFPIKTSGLEKLTEVLRLLDVEILTA